MGSAENDARGSGIGEVLTFDPALAAQDSFLMIMPAHGGDQRVGRANQNFIRPASPQLDWLLERARGFLGTNQCWFMPLLCGTEPVGGILWVAKDNTNSLSGISDLALVSQSWGMTVRTAQIREQQTVLTESLAGANRELGALQQQLVRAKSLASLGEMAAGAAHEMNNPLTVMCGKAQILAAKITDTAMKKDAGLIATQGEKLSQIITDMMEFAKPHLPKMGALPIVAVVEEAVAVAAERAGDAGGHVRIEAAQGIPEGRGDALQIRSAIAEVILNALQATRAENPSDAKAPHAGTAAGSAKSPEVTVQVRFDPLDSQLIVQVTDHGVGMGQDVMRNAFAPFFSAKTAGRNRGMGLAKALRWVENHGGTIRLDSALGSGTTAVVILPLNAAVPGGAADAREMNPAPASHRAAAAHR